MVSRYEWLVTSRDRVTERRPGLPTMDHVRFNRMRCNRRAIGDHSEARSDMITEWPIPATELDPRVPRVPLVHGNRDDSAIVPVELAGFFSVALVRTSELPVTRHISTAATDAPDEFDDRNRPSSDVSGALPSLRQVEQTRRAIVAVDVHLHFADASRRKDVHDASNEVQRDSQLAAPEERRRQERRQNTHRENLGAPVGSLCATASKQMHGAPDRDEPPRGLENGPNHHQYKRHPVPADPGLRKCGAVVGRHDESCRLIVDVGHHTEDAVPLGKESIIEVSEEARPEFNHRTRGQQLFVQPCQNHGRSRTTLYAERLEPIVAF